MVIAIGSYPIGRRFESHRRYQTACRRFAGGAFIPEAVRLSETTTAPRGLYRWPRGQAVKTSPFHGGNTSSILVGVTKQVKGEPVSIKRRIRLYCIFQNIEKRRGLRMKSPPLPLIKVYEFRRNLMI